eukprot:3059300-Ditylum_brightwellii.AAC.1
MSVQAYGYMCTQKLSPKVSLQKYTCSTQGWPPDLSGLNHCASTGSKPTKYYNTQGQPPDTNPHQKHK